MEPRSRLRDLERSMETSRPLASPASAQPLTPLGADGTAWTWRRRPDFGPWLRELREIAGLSLREAAGALGLHFTRLHKIETNGRAKAPSLELLSRVATVYGKELDLVLARAGFRMEVPEDLRDALACDEAFAALVLHPALRPACMDERWLEAFSRLQKAQIVELARKVDANARAGGQDLERILRDGRAAG